MATITGTGTPTGMNTRTTIAEPAAVPDQLKLLQLLQWLSPAFPTGAFAYSGGLEQAIAEDLVSDAASLERWIQGILRYGSGWQDAVVLARALAPGADHDALDALMRATAVSAERLTETREQGAALARTVSALTGRCLPPRALPVALGEAAAPLGVPTETVVAFYLQSLAGNLAVIAVRRVPLGQTEGQAVLRRLLPAIADIALAARDAPRGPPLAAAFGADLATMRHETLDVRLFRT